MMAIVSAGDTATGPMGTAATMAISRPARPAAARTAGRRRIGPRAIPPRRASITSGRVANALTAVGRGRARGRWSARGGGQRDLRMDRGDQKPEPVDQPGARPRHEDVI